MSINKVILIGNLGADPELKHTPGGLSVTNFSLATNETWKNKDGVKQTKTEWHKIVVWGTQAENVSRYLSKGSKVYLEGRLQTRTWEKDGQKHYTVEIVGESVQFLDTLAKTA